MGSISNKKERARNVWINSRKMWVWKGRNRIVNMKQEGETKREKGLAAFGGSWHELASVVGKRYHAQEVEGKKGKILRYTGRKKRNPRVTGHKRNIRKEEKGRLAEKRTRGREREHA